MGNQDANVQKKWSLVQSTACKRRAGRKPDSLQRGKLSRLLRKGMARGEASGQPREGKLLDFQNRVSYLQPNSATLPALMEPFTEAADKAERDSYTFWLGLAAATEALETAFLGDAL